MTAEATAVGISAGDGGNVIMSENSIRVTARATGDGEAHADSNLYDTDAGVWGRVTSTATGIETGKGSSLIVNQGLLQVDANASAATISFSDSVDDATARGAATVSASAWGIKAAGADSTDPKGATIVINSAPISVNAESAAEGKTGRADSGWFGYGLAVTYADAKSEAWGITIGGGNRLAAVENSSGLTVKAKANSAASAYGDDESQCTADASANGRRDPDRRRQQGGVDLQLRLPHRRRRGQRGLQLRPHGSAGAIGLDAGAGTNRIVNDGGIGVTANAIGVMTRTEATGLRSGIGADDIENHGGFSVQADATALMGSSRTFATGFDAGGGDNGIFSDGVIDVRSVAVHGELGSSRRGRLRGAHRKRVGPDREPRQPIDPGRGHDGHGRLRCVGNGNRGRPWRQRHPQ